MREYCVSIASKLLNAFFLRYKSTGTVHLRLKLISFHFMGSENEQVTINEAITTISPIISVNSGNIPWSCVVNSSRFSEGKPNHCIEFACFIFLDSANNGGYERLVCVEHFLLIC